MIKAIFFDIDGTLVGFRDHRISSSTSQALARMRRKGVKLFIATGRHPLGVDNLGDERFDGYIYMNGGLCTIGGRTVYRNPLDAAAVGRLLDALPQSDIACVFDTEQAWYINRTDERVRAMNAMINVDIPLINPERLRGLDIFQITPYLPPQEEWRVLQYMPEVKHSRWCDPIFDINPRDGGKGVALLQAARCLGIPPAQTMAFGDGGNDTEMLLAAGIGVAMGNATDELKDAADYITSSVDDDGIARAIEHFEREGVL